MRVASWFGVHRLVAGCVVMGCVVVGCATHTESPPIEVSTAGSEAAPVVEMEPVVEAPVEIGECRMSHGDSWQHHPGWRNCQMIWRFDYDGDGQPERVEVHIYDHAGNHVTTDTDRDGDGTTDETRLYAYNADGHQEREESDLDGDGETDEIWHYFYDEAGHQIRTHEDHDADGEVDSVTHYRYDGAGNMVDSSTHEL